MWFTRLIHIVPLRWRSVFDRKRLDDELDEELRDHVARLTDAYFSTIGINAIVGRTLLPEDDRVPGGHPVAVISHSYWSRRLAQAADAVGRNSVAERGDLHHPRCDAARLHRRFRRIPCGRVDSSLLRFADRR